MNRTVPIAFALLLLAAQSRAGGFESLGRELAGAAKEAGLQRVAVLFLEPIGRRSESECQNLSEALVVALVRTGKVQVVERSLLKKIMEEHHLALTGLLDSAALKRVGKFLP